MSTSRIVILGAGRPYRGVHPSAIQQTTANRRVLDWILSAFSSVFRAEFHYVGGYHINQVIQQYPHIGFSVNQKWQETGSATSLLIGIDTPPDKPHYVCYSDIVFTDRLVRLLSGMKDDLVVVVDRKWKTRYALRTMEDLRIAEKVCLSNANVTTIGKEIQVDRANGEFIGLVKLSVAVVTHLWTNRQHYQDALGTAGLPELITQLIQQGFVAKALEIDGGWSELNAPQDLARFVLGTKAESLHRLRPLLKKACIGDQVSFTVSDWQTRRQYVLGAIGDKFPKQRVIVRSSALTEDSWIQSNAGSFTSILNTPASDLERLGEAIETVVSSYGEPNEDHQILVQSMVPDVEMSGVILTRTLNHGGPYYVINYDDVTSHTDSVTGGHGHHLKTIIAHRSSSGYPVSLDLRIVNVIQAAEEIESLVGHNSLDIEFAVTADQQVHIFQTRPIAVKYSQSRVADEEVEHALSTAAKAFRIAQRPGPNLLGSRTVFGVMPDWNPAEIIGIKPHRLALSLYQYLITDDIWARQRAEHGYRDVRPCPLLISFVGHPYIDVRASFNSFIPRSLSNDLAERLVNHYLSQLVENPHWHDKVEFNIVFTALDFDFDQKAAVQLLENGFCTNDVESLRDGLRAVTLNGINRYQNDLDQLRVLDEKFQAIKQCNILPINSIIHLLHDCRELGTLPFAHLARDAFIAMGFLRSMERIGLLDNSQLTAFLNGLNTVTRQFELDGARVGRQEMSLADFTMRYGHLRPGTYDITSLSYAEDPERYLSPVTKASRGSEMPIESREIWDEPLRNATEQNLARLGLSLSVDDFIHFLKQAIAGREYAKFMFSRNLSTVLDLLVEFVKDLGMTRRQLSHISIEEFLQLRKGSPYSNAGAWLMSRSEEGEEASNLTQTIELPSLIISEEQFWCFERPGSQPNFVSHKHISAPILALAGEAIRSVDLNDKIVLISQADPGFDWIFGYRIAGLITTYGGANSHMTIRAAELNIPAAIGIGEDYYEQLRQARIVDLNCITRQIRIVS